MSVITKPIDYDRFTIYSIDREEAEDLFYEFLIAGDLDEYGYSDPNGKLQKYITDSEIYEIDTPLFTIRPYNLEIAEQDDIPNFVYKPENVMISWYKFPLKSASCNKELKKEDFSRIIRKCLNWVRTVEADTGYCDRAGVPIHESDIVRLAQTGATKETEITGIIRYGEYSSQFDTLKYNLGFYIDWGSDMLRKEFLYWVKEKKIEVIRKDASRPE